MEIHVQHVSGSKAGLEQTFTNGKIRIGREPSNEISFDPYQDILVSKHHAEIAFDGRQWILRDLNSSNGTYVGDERVTERAVKSGETVQFGRGGPRLQLKFNGPPRTHSEARVDNPGTRVMSVDDLVAGKQTTGARIPIAQAPAAEGTVMMNRADVHPVRAAAPAPATPRRSSPLRVVLLVAVLAFFLGIMGIVLLKPGAKGAKTAVPATAQQQELDKLRQQLAAYEAQMAELQRLRTQSTDAGGVEAQDLERQHADAQRIIDGLRQQLEQKNDEVLAAEQKPPQVVVKYIPVPQPARETQPVRETPRVQESAPQVPAASVMPPPLQSEPQTQIAAATIPSPSPAYQPAVQPPPATTPAPARRMPAPIQQTVAPPVQAATTPASRPAVIPAAVAPAATVAEPAPLKLAKWKRLKRRVVVSGVASDIPLVDAPRNLPTELAKSIGVALASSSDYFVDRNHGSVVRVTPMLFRSVEKKSDSSNVAAKIKGIGSILGKSTSSVRVPVRAQSASYDAALAAEVTVESGTGRILARSTPSSSLTDRRSSFSIVPAKTTFGDLLNQDTPISDVTRNVVAQAVDDVMRALASADADITVKSERGQVVTLDAGRNANIAPDDVFDVLDGDRAVARVRIESVQEATAVGRLVGSAGSVAGKKTVYAGVDITNDNNASGQGLSSTRAATVRVQTEGKEAPGASFNTVMALRPGIRTTYLFSVGSWSKVRNGDVALWVPTTAIDIR